MQGYNEVVLGNASFVGGVYEETYVWMIPFSADRLVRVRTVDGYVQVPDGVVQGQYECTPRSFTLAVRHDEELSQLLQNVTFTQGCAPDAARRARGASRQ